MLFGVLWVGRKITYRCSFDRRLVAIRFQELCAKSIFSPSPILGNELGTVTFESVAERFQI